MTNNVRAVGRDCGESRCQGDMEKADMVDGRKPTIICRSALFSGSVQFLNFRVFPGIKESVCWTPPPEVNPTKTCEYQALCSRFKDLLTLPGLISFPTVTNIVTS